MTFKPDPDPTVREKNWIRNPDIIIVYYFAKIFMIIMLFFFRKLSHTTSELMSRITKNYGR